MTRPPLPSLAAWVAGAALLAVLVASAVRFARLPPAAVDATTLGWQGGLTVPSLVVLDDDGKTAWIAHGRSLCRVRTVDGRALRCDALPFESSDVREHVRARDRLLLVAIRGNDPGPNRYEMRAVVARTDAPLLDPGWSELYDSIAGSLRNAGWNEARSRFELYADDGREAHVIPISPDGVAGPREGLTIDRTALRGPLFPVIVLGDPPGLLAGPVEGGEVVRVRGGRLEPTGFTCVGGLLGCVTALSSMRYGELSLYEPRLWVGPTGEERPAPHIEGTAYPRHWLYDVVERGGAADAVGWSDESNALLVRVPWGPPLTFRRVHAGMEDVLVATRQDGTMVRLARGVVDVSPIPHDGGLLLLSQNYGGRVVALDRELRRVDDVPGHTGLVGNGRALVAEHWRLAPVEVALYAGLLVLLPTLLAWCGPRLARRRAVTLERHVDVGSPLAALVACDLAAAWLVASQWNYLFPP